MNIRCVVLILGFAVVGCTKRNPAVCCNTPTQCASIGLDGVTGCETGKVCDPEGACIAPQCASSVECGSDSPYCSSAGLCAMSCVADTECPGGGQGSSQVHCSNGACVECASAADCPASAPICSSSACRECEQNEECASEVCGMDGTCVGSDAIAYVDPSGTDAADCSKATPCKLSRGVSLGRPYTVVASGTYQTDQALTMAGTRSLIGIGATPSITRTTPGPIIAAGIDAHLDVSNLLFSGATNTSSTSRDGSAIQCSGSSTQGTVRLTDVVVTGNAFRGVDGTSCAVTATRSSFDGNGESGLFVANNTAAIDRCNFHRNGADGFQFDGSIAMVTNSFFTGNLNIGMEVSTQDDGGYIRFSTIANNKIGIQVGIAISTVTFDLTNNLVAGNPQNGILCAGGTCSQAGSIVLGSDISTAHFKSSTDYHITAGSVAIDAAAPSTLDHDYDGDMRPLGNGRDVGADEAQ